MDKKALINKYFENMGFGSNVKKLAQTVTGTLTDGEVPSEFVEDVLDLLDTDSLKTKHAEIYIENLTVGELNYMVGLSENPMYRKITNTDFLCKLQEVTVSWWLNQSEEKSEQIAELFEKYE